jgi:hypothetical protein
LAAIEISIFQIIIQMKKVTTTTLLFFLLTTLAFGQTKTYYHRNPFGKTFTKVLKAPTFGADSLELKKYLTDKLQNQLSETAGEIKVGLLIDSSGKPLCEWIDNQSNFKMDKGKLNLIIDEMPNWNPGFAARRNVDCTVMLTLTFNRQDLLVQYRTGTD